MQQYISKPLALVALLWISGCAGTSQHVSGPNPDATTLSGHQAPTPDNRTVTEIVTSTKILQQEATQLGHAWLMTNKHLSEAEMLIGSGETNSARNAALRAELSARASIAQAHSEKGAWQDRFPK